MESTRYQTGFNYLCHVEGAHHPSIVDALAEIAPDLASLVIRFVYGEIYPRPHLTLKERQLVAVATLATLGNARPQLKFHIAGALNVGCSSQEIIELMLHLVIYAGFPAGLNGVWAAQEVFQDHGVAHVPVASLTRAQKDRGDSRYRAGWAALSRIDGRAGEDVIASLATLAPDLARYIIEFAFGDIYTRSGLSLVQRELITVATLTAKGTAAVQLKVHAQGLLNVGGTRDQLVETLIHISAYCGFPATINALHVIQEILGKRGRGT
ncbi:carboxymuconolactone decarboxylase [Acidiferrobacter sp. SPIII_3]|jgi:4-carboxymuconolactone decarboxylase|uniref:carboxymuconolactone decarboxylase family protein n=1 Tax=Acidiferrobacter sp. SPIII_3 TaxID=1281578 RepID=UPI000D725396|nr:carboxymuconolactone decarboxylase family protein [Acidiferrobacter sp. SPIII_3]AWP23382.1 carboxymuconolactone decarboxylase [Acidiferrobacter sp. SPIII_3]